MNQYLIEQAQITYNNLDNMHETIKPIFRLAPQLAETIQYIYQPAGLFITSIEPEEESQEYAATRLIINHQQALFRVAKTTPKKIGQFVTVWKRNSPTSSIVPFDNQDLIHWLIVHVHDHAHQGQFIFPRTLLLAKKIMSTKNIGGKRGFRLYPPWVLPHNPTAIKTQQWQMDYFLPIGEKYAVDFTKVRLMLINQ